MAKSTSTDTAWEYGYNRPLFEAMAKADADGKLRYLVYVNDKTADYWLEQRNRGAVVLGNY